MGAARSARGFELGRRLLFGIMILMAVFGLSLTVFDNRAVPGLHAALNESLWGVPALPSNVVVYHRLLHAILGATIASWAVALAFVVHHTFRAGQSWGWWCVLGSTLIWFVPDTAASLYYGAWPNALFNLSCLVGVALPLALTRSLARA